jgi:hypothetical protein
MLGDSIRIVLATSMVEQNINPLQTLGTQTSLLQYGHRISVGSVNWIGNNQNQHLQIQMNSRPRFWEHCVQQILGAPLWCFVQSTFSHAQGGCVFSSSAANLWINQTMPVMSMEKQWWVMQWTSIFRKYFSRLAQLLNVRYFRNKAVMCLYSSTAELSPPPLAILPYPHAIKIILICWAHYSTSKILIWHPHKD